MDFSRHEYWSGLPFPSPGDLPNPGLEPRVSCLAGRFFAVWATRESEVNASPKANVSSDGGFFLSQTEYTCRWLRIPLANHFWVPHQGAERSAPSSTLRPLLLLTPSHSEALPALLPITPSAFSLSRVPPEFFQICFNPRDLFFSCRHSHPFRYKSHLYTWTLGLLGAGSLGDPQALGQV